MMASVSDLSTLAFAAENSQSGAYAELPGVKLWFTDSGGAGVPIILLHSNSGTSLIWENQVRSFSAVGYRVITFDRRGWGKSVADAANGTQPGSIAGDLDALASPRTSHADSWSIRNLTDCQWQTSYKPTSGQRQVRDQVSPPLRRDSGRSSNRNRHLSSSVNTSRLPVTNRLNQPQITRVSRPPPGKVVYCCTSTTLRRYHQVGRQNLFESLILTSRYMNRLAAEVHQIRRL